MKKACFVVLLLVTFAWAKKAPVNPADYNVAVHVSAARLDLGLRLHVTISGKKYELQGRGLKGLMAVGDYKARLVKDEHPTAYYSHQTYEFLFPDGVTEKFDVTGTKE